MLPKTFFAELAEKSPLVIFDNQLYQIGENASGDSLIVGDSQFSLVQSDTLLNLENFYRDINAEQIFEFKKDHINEKFDKEIASSSRIKSLVSEFKIVNFLVNEVFPYFLDTDDVDTLLEGRSEEQHKPHVQNIESVINELSEGLGDNLVLKTKAQPVIQEAELSEEGEVEGLLSHYYSVEKPEEIYNSLLSVALGNNDVLIFNDHVYPFAKRNLFRDVDIVIDGQKYQVSKDSFCSSSSIEDKYRDKLRDQIRLEAEEESKYQSRFDDKIDMAAKFLKKFLEKDSFGIGDVGFIRHGENYYATLKVHPYILYDTKDNTGYYKFPGCKIAVEIGDDLSRGHAVVVGSYRHPFVGDLDPWKSICMGDYSSIHLKELDKAGEIAGYLSDVRNTLQTGYTSECAPYYNLSRDFFNSYRISERRAKSSDLPITNVRGGK